MPVEEKEDFDESVSIEAKEIEQDLEAEKFINSIFNFE